MKETTARQMREEKKIWRVPVFSFEAGAFHRLLL
jgi:hypothetical protein